MRVAFRAMAVVGLLAAITAPPDAVAKDRKAKKAAASTPAAQQAPAPSAVNPEVELQGIVQQLASTHDQAMKDPEIAKAHADLQASIDQEIQKADPSFDKKVARLQEIVTELESKVGTEGADVTPLIQEGQQIQTQLEAVQAKVMGSEPTATRIEQFDVRLRAKMTELEPKTPQLMERADQLVQQLNARSPES